MGQVQAGDVKLYYEVEGSCEPLLMIMGLGSSSATWSPVLVAELSRHFQTIVYDNRGTGQVHLDEVGELGPPGGTLRPTRKRHAEPAR
jgi:pimeloyl-ACP methyl ester carboxylesterase